MNGPILVFRCKNLAFFVTNPAWLLLLVCFTAGCTSGVYQVANLPAEHLAESITPADTIDLSRFATKGSDQDTIAWGDLLDVQLTAGTGEDDGEPTQVRVAKDGTIVVPPVGSVRVSGFQVEQAEQILAETARCRNLFVHPFVSVKIAEQRTNQVTVVGAVNKPGTYSLPRGQSSLMACLVEAEGLANDTNLQVEVRRSQNGNRQPEILQAQLPYGSGFGQGVSPVSATGQPEIVQVSLTTFDPNAPGKYVLHDGDVVTVGKRDLPSIQVMGLVRKPGPIEITGEEDVRLLDAIAMAGGCSNGVADKILVVRHSNGEPAPVRIGISLQKAIDGDDNLLLCPGDTVLVRHTPATVFVETIRSFFRIGISGSAAMW